MNFSEARLKDAGAIVTLVNSAYRGDSSRMGWTTEADFLGGQRVDTDGIGEVLATTPSKILLAFEDAELIGCVELTKLDDDIVLLGMLTVQPQLQNRGVGGSLLKYAEQWAAANFGAKKMILKVISIRAELIAYYQRKSYELKDEYERFPYGDARFGIPKRDDLEFVRMEKIL